VTEIRVDFSKDFSRSFDGLQDAVRKSAAFALNEGARFGRVRQIDKMADEINLPRSYMSRRMDVAKAYPGQPVLQAKLRGTHVPVSLSRFLARPSLRNTPNARSTVGKVSVRVLKKGAAKDMKRAFLVRLRKGKELTSDQYNVGLAMRLPNSAAVTGRKKPLRALDRGTRTSLFLLHGPSVDQLFRREVDTEHALNQPVLNAIEREFFRQLKRLGV
jgi:hypothetical protein